VSQCKFALSKVMPRNICGEIREFFPKGLNPFKIQIGFKFDLFLELNNSKSLGIWNLGQKEICLI
jgi:hypothetical protein